MRTQISEFHRKMILHNSKHCGGLNIPHVIALITTLLILAACSSSSSTFTDVKVQPSLPTSTSEPTFTPLPISADTPIHTPTDTPTPEPTPPPSPEQVSLSGRILDQGNNRPIANAQVSAGSASTTTDSDGRYTLTDLSPGQYVLSVTHPDYDPGLSSILIIAAGEEQSQDLALYAPDTSPYPQDPMLTNPLDPNGAPTAEDAERLAREQGLTGDVVSIRETKLSGEFLVNYKIGDTVRAAVAEVRHEVWELRDEAGREWWIIKVCGNLASRLPQEAPIPTPRKPIAPLLMAEVVVDGLVVRECTSEECGEVGTIPGGERVEVFGCLASGDWCEVGWSGVRGWCTGRSLRQLAVATVIPSITPVLSTSTPMPTPTPTREVVVAGEGKIAFVSDRDGIAEIYTINPDGSGLARLTNYPARKTSPAWSPDGLQIAFASNRDGPDPQNCERVFGGPSCNWEIYVMNSDGSGLTRLTNDTARNFNPTWSPDGSRIAFDSTPGGLINIYVMDTDGSGQTQLTNDPTGASLAPAWSPGKQIAFYTLRDNGNQEIYAMNADGSGQTRLTYDSASDITPAWSPSGDRIAFVSGSEPRVDADWGIYIMKTDGSGRTRLTDGSLGSSLTWSPDGTRIAFNRDGSIYVMNVDGSDLRYLTEGSSPTWSR